MGTSFQTVGRYSLMEMLGTTIGIFARYVDGWWEDPQPSALSFLGGDTDELDEQWPRSGRMHAEVAHRRFSSPRRAADHPWPTPTARLGDSKRGSPSPRLARAWMDEGRRNLDDAVVLFAHSLWPTPTTQDAKNDGAPSQQGRNSKPLNALVVLHPEGTKIERPKALLLNAEFVELLMGFPEGWTDVG